MNLLRALLSCFLFFGLGLFLVPLMGIFRFVLNPYEGKMGLLSGKWARKDVDIVDGRWKELGRNTQ